MALGPELAVLAALFLLAAAVYATAGFGGGSAYIAMLTLAGVPITHVAVVALACNVIVVAGGSWQFGRRAQIDWRLAAPLLVTSIPAAYVGGRMVLADASVALFTGFVLLAAALALLLSPPADPAPGERRGPADRSLVAAPAIGGVLGGAAGVVGIGGGVFLAPILYFLGWGSGRQIAGLTSVFILANSVAGLAGKAAHVGDHDLLTTYGLLFVAVLIGGQLGSRIGATKLSPVALRRITAVVVMYAGVNLLLAGA